MAVVHQAGDLPQPQLALEQAHLLVGQNIGEGLAVAPGAAGSKTLSGDAGIAPFAIGQQIKIGSDDLLKEFGTVAAAIKNHGEPSLAHQRTYLGEYPGEHFDQAGVGLSGDNEQRVAGAIVDPII